MEFNKKSTAENVNNPSTNSSANQAANGNDEKIKKQNYVKPKQLVMLSEPSQLLHETASGGLEAITTPLSTLQIYNRVPAIGKKTTSQRDILFITHNVMYHVFKYLSFKDHLNLIKVCSSWRNMLQNNNVFWRSISLNGVTVCNWFSLVEFMNKKGTVSLDTSCMVIPFSIGYYILFWIEFKKAINNAHNIKTITLHNCPTTVIENVMLNLPNLEVLIAYPGDIRNFQIDLSYITYLPLLRVLKIKGLYGSKNTKILAAPTFKSSTHLKTLSLINVAMFPDSGYQSLKTLSTDIEVLELEHNNCFKSDIINALDRLTNLTNLRLKNSDSLRGPSCAPCKPFFTAIKQLGKLNRLELINFFAHADLLHELKFCSRTKFVLITTLSCNMPRVPSDIMDNVFKCIDHLFESSNDEIWGIVSNVSIYFDDKSQLCNHKRGKRSETITRSPSVTKLYKILINPKKYDYKADAKYQCKIEIINPNIEEQPSTLYRFNYIAIQIKFGIHYVP